MDHVPPHWPKKRYWTQREFDAVWKEIFGDAFTPDKKAPEQRDDAKTFKRVYVMDNPPPRRPSKRPWTQKEFEALLKEVSRDSLTLAEPNTEEPEPPNKFEVRFFQYTDDQKAHMKRKLELQKPPKRATTLLEKLRRIIEHFRPRPSVMCPSCGGKTKFINSNKTYVECKVCHTLTRIVPHGH